MSSSDDKTRGTSRGIPITDEVIERLASEAEAGYHPAELRRRGDSRSRGNAPAEVVPGSLGSALELAAEQSVEDDGA